MNVEELLLTDETSSGGIVYDTGGEALVLVEQDKRYKIRRVSKQPRMCVGLDAVDSHAFRLTVGNMIYKAATRVPGLHPSTEVWDDACDRLAKRDFEARRMIRGQGTWLIKKNEIMVVGHPEDLGRILCYGNRRGAFVYAKDPAILLYRAFEVNRFDKVVNGVVDLDAVVRPIRELHPLRAGAPTAR